MPNTRPALTPHGREQRRTEQRELVRASIEQLRTSDGWQAYLKARRRFSSYSWRNVLLILSQHPTAHHVAGFRKWLELGYAVQRGQHGIKIWARCAPSHKRMQAWRNAGADPDERPRATYKLVSVFAHDQVAPLPPPAKPVPLTAPIAEISGDSHQDLFAGIVGLAGEIGYTVCVCDTGPADGTCNRTTHEIKIAERLSPNGRLAAAIHELSHALVGADEQAPKLTYAQEELVVESIAFCCCQTVGLDTGANSIPYLTSWAESASLDVLEQTVELTARLADRIEAVLVADPAAAQPGAEQLVDTPQAIAR
jgi:antirestriction protein ArdC